MHTIYKSESTTTKLRVVLDASAKSSTGISLYDSLLFDQLSILLSLMFSYGSVYITWLSPPMSAKCTVPLNWSQITGICK